MKCRNRRGGVPQRARLTAESHYHRTAQLARGGGGRGRGGRSRERGEGARAIGFTACLLVCEGGREGVSKLHSAEEDGGGLSITSSYVSLSDSF